MLFDVKLRKHADCSVLNMFMLCFSTQSIGNMTVACVSCVVLWDINMHVRDVSVKRVTVCTLHVATINSHISVSFTFWELAQEIGLHSLDTFSREARRGWV